MRAVTNAIMFPAGVQQRNNYIPHELTIIVGLRKLWARSTVTRCPESIGIALFCGCVLRSCFQVCRSSYYSLLHAGRVTWPVARHGGCREWWRRVRSALSPTTLHGYRLSKGYYANIQTTFFNNFLVKAGVLSCNLFAAWHFCIDWVLLFSSEKCSVMGIAFN